MNSVKDGQTTIKKVWLYFLLCISLIGGFSISYSGITTLTTSIYASTEETQISDLTNDLLTSKKEEGDGQLKEKAQARKKLLVTLAEKDPAAFLKLASLKGKKRDLPESIRDEVEEVIETEGEYVQVYLDKKDSAKLENVLFSTSDSKAYKLYFAQSPTGLKSGSKVKIKAVKLDSILVIGAPDGSEDTSFQTTSESLLASPSVENTAVLLVNFSNDTSQPTTQEDIRSLVFTNPDSVNAYYQENSYGQKALTGQIFGWITLSQDNSGCEYSYYNWSTEADTKAAQAGIDLSPYQRIVYVFAPSPTCGYVGFGTVGGSPGRSWILNYIDDTRVYGHEFGHNMGLYHAGSIQCGALAIDIYSNCTQDEYGDYFDVMGNFWFVTPYQLHFNGAHKAELGWVPDARVTTVTSSGTYRIEHLESAQVQPQMLKISKPNTNEFYIISFRKALGFDSGLSEGLTRGASIHIKSPYPAVQTKFIDTTPNGGDFNGFGDATLADGQIFTDIMNGIEVKQLSHTQDYVDIEVRVPGGTTPTNTPTRTPTPTPLSDTVKPLVSITYPTHGTTVPRNTKITVTATASDNVGVARVRFIRNGSVICTDTIAPYSCAMNTAFGSGVIITYKAKAFDAAGNVRTATSKVTTTN